LEVLGKVATERLSHFENFDSGLYLVSEHVRREVWPEGGLMEISGLEIRRTPLLPTLEHHRAHHPRVPLLFFQKRMEKKLRPIEHERPYQSLFVDDFETSSGIILEISRQAG
jgi:hypothetical protein